MISVQEALDIVLRELPRSGTEEIALTQSRGRVLACDTSECGRPADNMCAGCKALTCSIHGKLIGGEFTVCRGCFESGVTMADIA